MKFLVSSNECEKKKIRGYEWEGGGAHGVIERKDSEEVSLKLSTAPKRFDATTDIVRLRKCIAPTNHL